MSRLRRFVRVVVVLLMLVHALSATAMAQRPRTSPPPPPPEACAACAGCAGFMIFIPIAILVLHVVLLVWVARDAKARGLQNEVLWLILIAMTGPIGLVVYVFSRPEGKLAPCQYCRKPKLPISQVCPHCGRS